MKSIRESRLFANNKRLSERKSVVGAFNAFGKDVFRDKIWYPHEEMIECIDMYNRNSYAQSAINTMKDFIKGGDIVVKSKDEFTRIMAQSYLDLLNTDIWIDEIIENTIKTGNGYLELDYSDAEWKKIVRCYPIPDSSRFYINCDALGLPKKVETWTNNPLTGDPQKMVKRDESEFYIQRVDPGIRHSDAKWYDMSYHVGFRYHTFRIYGIPIHKRKIIHFKLNMGDTGIYGRSPLASTLDDNEILKQIERSIAIIAKYKAVPRDILSYGDKENPATDDETTEFIMYLESLEKDESAIINKPIQRESLAYSGQEINMNYMLQHIKKKIIAGIAPEFLMGMSGDSQKAEAQITLISYILTIYTKRKLFLKPMEDHILKPFLKMMKLQKAWLEFGELDFETQSEKTNRVGAMWTQNLLTFNQATSKLGLPPRPDGDKFYMQWQSEMMPNMMGGGMPSFGAPGEEETLPNGEDADQVFSHNTPPNKQNVQDGGRLPNDPYQEPTDTPKFMQKKKQDSVLNSLMKEVVDLEKDFDESILPYEWDIDKKGKDKGKWKRVWPAGKEKVTITIDDNDLGLINVKKISYDTLIKDFGNLFNEPRITEIYYKELEDGWKISFNKNDVDIMCEISFIDILKGYGNPEEMSEEEKEGLISAWENQYLRKTIKEE